MSQLGTINLKVIDRLWSDAELLFDGTRAALNSARQLTEQLKERTRHKKRFAAKRCAPLRK